ncbi:MAG: DUF2062 domain-containing protein [Terracidiphilus sp.]
MRPEGSDGQNSGSGKTQSASLLSLGISPRRLALTLALGFAVGCIPVIGIPTVLCAGLALALRLNQPAIQAANYAAMPLQFALIIPFVRLGGWITSSPVSAKSASFLLPRAIEHLSAINLASLISGMAGEALLAWLVAAIPAVFLMTVAFYLLLRRIPRAEKRRSGRLSSSLHFLIFCNRTEHSAIVGLVSQTASH